MNINARFALLLGLGLVMSFINAFFFVTLNGHQAVYWWADNASGLYLVLFPHEFAMGPPAVLIFLLKAAFCTIFNVLAIALSLYIWERGKR
jgi:hypothetical protein